MAPLLLKKRALGDVDLKLKGNILIAFFLCVPLWAETPSPTRNEEKLPRVSISEPLTYVEPSNEPRTDVETIRIRYLTTPKGSTYVIPDQPWTIGQRDEFSKLTAKDRKTFHQRRLATLEFFAAFLDKYTSKIGSLAAAKASLSMQGYHFIPTPGGPPPPEGVSSQVFKEPDPKDWDRAGKQIAQSFLNAASQQIWSHPSILAKSNEGGISLSIGLGGGAGVGGGSRGNFAFFRNFHLGLSLGYDWEKNRLTLDLFSDVERNQKVTGAYAMIETTGRLMGYVRSTPSNGEIESSRGRTHYPPIPVMLFHTPNTFGSGFMLGMGIGTAPPLIPIPTYTFMENRVTRRPWIRLGIAKDFPFLSIEGEIRDRVVQTGRLAGSLFSKIPGVKQACHWVFKKIK